MLEYEYIVFQWDENKSIKNKQKHGLSFKVAHRAFFDEHRVTLFHRIENGEERWKTLAMLDGEVILFIGHTLQEDSLDREVITIITARKADPKEREEYYVYYSSNL